MFLYIEPAFQAGIMGVVRLTQGCAALALGYGDAGPSGLLMFLGRRLWCL